MKTRPLIGPMLKIVGLPTLKVRLCSASLITLVPSEVRVVFSKKMSVVSESSEIPTVTCPLARRSAAL